MYNRNNYLCFNSEKFIHAEHREGMKACFFSNIIYWQAFWILPDKETFSFPEMKSGFLIRNLHDDKKFSGREVFLLWEVHYEFKEKEIFENKWFPDFETAWIAKIPFSFSWNLILHLKKREVSTPRWIAPWSIGTFSQSLSFQTGNLTAD